MEVSFECYPQLILHNTPYFFDQINQDLSKFPIIYSRFLELTQLYKLSKISTAEYIIRSHFLFIGFCDSLIFAFNHVLPPGYYLICDNGDLHPRLLTTNIIFGSVNAQDSVAEKPTKMSAPSVSSLVLSNTQLTVSQCPISPPASPSIQSTGLTKTLKCESFDIRKGNSSSSHKELNSTDFVGLDCFPVRNTNNKLIKKSSTRTILKKEPHPASQNPVKPLPEINIKSQPVKILPKPKHEKNKSGSYHHYRNPSTSVFRYVERIKNRFQNTPEIFTQFLIILRSYNSGKTPPLEVYNSVANLFLPGSKDLLAEFRSFLPPSISYPPISKPDDVKVSSNQS